MAKKTTPETLSLFSEHTAQPTFLSVEIGETPGPDRSKVLRGPCLVINDRGHGKLRYFAAENSMSAVLRSLADQLDVLENEE